MKAFRVVDVPALILIATLSTPALADEGADTPAPAAPKAVEAVAQKTVAKQAVADASDRKPVPKVAAKHAPEPEPAAEEVVTASADDEPEKEGDAPPPDEPVEPVYGPLSILGGEVAPGETKQFRWKAIESFAGSAQTTPVLVARGAKDGPTLCLTAAVHGDELNGIEIVRRVMSELDAEDLSGTVIGVPIVNVYGFQRASRYLPDRRDLNRYFPGDPRGSSANRIAHAFFENVIRHCDALVDMHTGSFHRSNLTQLRANIAVESVRELCDGFGVLPVLHNEGSPGTLRRAATDAGIPAVTIEAGEPMRLEPSVVDKGVEGVLSLLAHRSMIRRLRLFGSPQPVYYRSTWIRSDAGGILFSLVELGDAVGEGDPLGTVTDPITNARAIVTSPYSGTVLGKAVNQFVMPGFAVFRIGVETDDAEVSESPGATLPEEPPLEGEPGLPATVEDDMRPE